MKRCTKCGIEKPLDEFNRHRRNADGLQAWCKPCQRAYYAANRERKARANHTWYKANRERIAKQRRAYYEDNREYVLEKSRAYYAANRERAAETNRAWYKANRERAAEKAARHRAKHPEREAARNAVSNAVKLGKLPAASTQVCIVCGKPAQNWHHYLGYVREHWLDVIAACGMCHVELDKEQQS